MPEYTPYHTAPSAAKQQMMTQRLRVRPRRRNMPASSGRTSATAAGNSHAAGSSQCAAAMPAAKVKPAVASSRTRNAPPLFRRGLTPQFILALPLPCAWVEPNCYSVAVSASGSYSAPKSSCAASSAVTIALYISSVMKPQSLPLFHAAMALWRSTTR